MDLIWGLVALALGQLIGFGLSSVVLEEWRARQAYQKLRGERLIARGVVLDSVVSKVSGSKIMGCCVVTSVQKGRVEVRSLNRDLTPAGKAISWTGAELLDMHPITQVQGPLGHPVRIQF